MKIGELSRRTDVSIRMLRYYEAEGLLAPPRTAGGYRDYGPLEETTVKQIKMLGAAGMTLSTIRQFLPCALDERPIFEPCDELKSTLRQQINLVDERIGKLAESRGALVNILAELDSGTP